MHQGFVKKGTIRFYTPNLCIRYDLGGVINYTASIARWYEGELGGWLYTQKVSNISITTPTLTIDAFRASGSSCTTTRTVWSEATLKMLARGYGCNFNPSIQVSVPWSIGVSAWPTCGSVRLAAFKTTLTQRASHHEMVRSHDAIRFSDGQFRTSDHVQTDIHWTCYGFGSQIGVTVTNVGDDSKPSARAKACPGWEGGWGIFAGVDPVTYYPRRSPNMALRAG